MQFYKKEYQSHPALFSEMQRQYCREYTGEWSEAFGSRRNSIYARHGYSFKNRKMRYFFDNYIDWYMPVNTDIRNSLTDIEKRNIELLKRYEEHAENYYDEYGR